MKKSDRNPQKRHWIGTIQSGHLDESDGDDGFASWFKRLTEVPGLRFAVAQVESAPETGTLHLQVYAEFKRSLRLTEVYKRIPGHWEYIRGTRTDAMKYCSKTDTRVDGPWRWGQWRTDTVSEHIRPKAIALSYIADGRTPWDLADEQPDVFFAHHRSIMALWIAINSHGERSEVPDSEEE